LLVDLFSFHGAVDARVPIPTVALASVSCLGPWHPFLPRPARYCRTSLFNFFASSWFEAKRLQKRGRHALTGHLEDVIVDLDVENAKQ
jgi:hypothetical protein